MATSKSAGSHPARAAALGPVDGRDDDRDEDRPEQARYVAFLHRVPFALDAYLLGFATGVREDYRLRQHMYQTVDLPVWMLDNDFRNPDIDRLLDHVETYRPRVVAIGDAYTADDAGALLDLVDDFHDRVDDVAPMIVPKSHGALEAIPRDVPVIVGYPNAKNYGDVLGPDFSRPPDWYGRDVHILGGSPPKAWETIKRLTDATDPGQSSLEAFGDRDEDRGSRPRTANIVGLDWNGLQGVAYKGEYWHHEKPHWRRADDLSIRDTVRRGLENVRRYWKARGVWPTSTPIDAGAHGLVPATTPDDHVCAGCGTDLLNPDDVEHLVEYVDAWTLAYCSTTCRDRTEYHSDRSPITDSDGSHLLSRSTPRFR